MEACTIVPVISKTFKDEHFKDTFEGYVWALGTIFPCILKKGQFIRLKSTTFTNTITGERRQLLFTQEYESSDIKG